MGAPPDYAGTSLYKFSLRVFDQFVVHINADEIQYPMLFCGAISPPYACAN